MAQVAYFDQNRPVPGAPTCFGRGHVDKIVSWELDLFYNPAGCAFEVEERRSADNQDLRTAVSVYIRNCQGSFGAVTFVGCTRGPWLTDLPEQLAGLIHCRQAKTVPTRNGPGPLPSCQVLDSGQGIDAGTSKNTRYFDTFIG